METAYFFHPELQWPGDARRARLWHALSMEWYLTTAEMMAICKSRGE